MRSVITTRFFEVVAVRWVFRCVAGMLQRCEGCGLYYDVSDPQEYAKHKNH